MSYLAEITATRRRTEDLRIEPLLDKLARQIAEVERAAKRERVYAVTITVLTVALIWAVRS